MGQFDDFISRYFQQRFVADVASYAIPCWLATNQEGGPVSYARSDLGYQSRPNGLPFVTGEVQQLFDDRTSARPFDPASADRTIITLRPQTHPDLTTIGGGGVGEQVIQVEFVSITWGGGRFDLQDVACRASVITGYGSPIGQRGSEALYTLSFGTPYNIG
jgi:hypothetical protein